MADWHAELLGELADCRVLNSGDGGEVGWTVDLGWGQTVEGVAAAGVRPDVGEGYLGGGALLEEEPPGGVEEEDGEGAVELPARGRLGERVGGHFGGGTDDFVIRGDENYGVLLCCVEFRVGVGGVGRGGLGEGVRIDRHRKGRW